MNNKEELSQNSDLWPSVETLPRLQEKVVSALNAHGIPFESTLLACWGQLGDAVQITPIAKALKLRDPSRPVVVLISNYASVLEEHPYIDLVIEYPDWSSQQQVVKSMIGLVETVVDVRYVSRAYGALPTAEFSFQHTWYYDNHPQSNARLRELGKHVSDLMLHSLRLEGYANCNDVCITPDEAIERIPGKYVVIQNNTGQVGRLKRWTNEAWVKMVDWCIEQGIKPVQIGTESDALIDSRVLDLRGKTTPRQAAAYLKYSKGYIGVEGALFHLAKSVGTPAVVIFASTPPEALAYPDTFVAGHHHCYPCLWAPGWAQGICALHVPHCLNLPSFEEVAALAAKMLNTEDQ